MSYQEKNFLDKTGLTQYDTLIKQYIGSSVGAVYEAYGECSSEASAQVKVVTINNQSWTLFTGAVISVKFTNSNTYNATSAAPCQLNVNNTGAIGIYYGDSANPIGSDTKIFGSAGKIIRYQYNGTYWVWVGMSEELDTTYESKTASQSGTDVSLVTTGEKYSWNSKTNIQVSSTQPTNQSTGDIWLVLS